ncbi:MAG: type II CAAX endopeptidase family protein [bacterium]
MKYVKAFVWMFLLFLGVYLPSFILIGILRLSGPGTVLLIIVTSFLVALLIMVIFLTRGGGHRKDFGLVSTGKRYLLGAFVLGGILGLMVAVLQRVFGIQSPRTFEAFAFWQIVLLFWIGASIQEEFIFRSLIQSVVGRTLGSSTLSWGPVSAAAVIVAVLFALIHVPTGMFTACAALVAGLSAGELRARSGSILPAVIVHAMFNITGTI